VLAAWDPDLDGDLPRATNKLERDPGLTLEQPPKRRAEQAVDAAEELLREASPRRPGDEIQIAIELQHATANDQQSD
jgi:hypothetical protein